MPVLCMVIVYGIKNCISRQSGYIIIGKKKLKIFI